VYLDPGTPNKSTVIENNKITFKNIQVTIRGPEKIPINALTFKIFDSSNQQLVAHVIFSVDGTKNEDSPSGAFSVLLKNVIPDDWYGYGYRWGYDESDGSSHSFGDGYGYGYGYSGYTDITLTYDIIYTTHRAGSFFAKLYVDSEIYTFASTKSNQFTVLPASLPPMIYVDINNIEGPWEGTLEYPYNNIQEAVNAVEPGGTVFVSFGTYSEAVSIEKSLNLVGAGIDNTIIEYSEFDHVVSVAADSVNITGFTVRGATFPQTAGIYAIGSDFCNITNNNITNNYYGIWLKTSSDNVIYENSVYSNTMDGVYLKGSTNNIVSTNYLFSNSRDAINLRESLDNIIEYNEVFNNFRYGIYLYDSVSNFIENNILSSNSDDGISFDSSIGNSIIGNTVTGNTNNGINLESSNNNIIDDNIVNSNTNDGILFEAADSNTISGNRIYLNNINGINLLASLENIFTDNNISNNNENGIKLYTSNDNSFTQNFILTNGIHGIYLYSSENNRVYNNYLSNPINAWDNDDNVWNLGRVPGTNIIGGEYIGGNFWDDYEGTDLDGDGLGNTLLPYNADNNVIIEGDYNPLTSQYTNHEPNQPMRPSGPTRGKEGVSYTYQTATTDPDNDEISYLFDWGDGTTSGWTQSIPSGQVFIISHRWSAKGNYQIKVKSKDKYGFESEWSPSLVVSMPKNKNILLSFITLLMERLLERFSILQRIITNFQQLKDSYLYNIYNFRGD
jgi:parallel beta-helix repeat protein